MCILHRFLAAVQRRGKQRGGTQLLPSCPIGKGILTARPTARVCFTEMFYGAIWVRALQVASLLGPGDQFHRSAGREKPVVRNVRILVRKLGEYHRLQNECGIGRRVGEVLPELV